MVVDFDKLTRDYLIFRSQSGFYCLAKHMIALRNPSEINRSTDNGQMAYTQVIAQ